MAAFSARTFTALELDSKMKASVHYDYGKTKPMYLAAAERLLIISGACRALPLAIVSKTSRLPTKENITPAERLAERHLRRALQPKHGGRDINVLM